MPQLFQVLHCYSCSMYQVHQVKKSKKWECKVCGAKQSLLKAFKIGPSRDCRDLVQQLNFRKSQNTIDGGHENVYHEAIHTNEDAFKIEESENKLLHHENEVKDFFPLEIDETTRRNELASLLGMSKEDLLNTKGINVHQTNSRLNLQDKSNLNHICEPGLKSNGGSFEKIPLCIKNTSDVTELSFPTKIPVASKTTPPYLKNKGFKLIAETARKMDK